MATVIDMKGISPAIDGNTASLKPRSTPMWLKVTVTVLIIFTIIVLVMSSVAISWYGAQAYAVTSAVASGDVLSDSPNPPSGYVYGGQVVHGYRAWVDKAPLLVARSDLGVVYCNTKFYIVGGQDSSTTNYSSVVTEYDPVFETLTPLSPLPTPLTRFAIGCLNDQKVIVAGGCDDMTNCNNGIPTGAVSVYDIASNVWSASTPLPTPRSDCAGAVVDGRFYVVGGYEAGFTTTGKTEVLSGTTWSTVADMPTKRGDVGASVMGGKVYAVGGWNNVFQAAVEAFNPATGKWEVKANLPAPHGDAAIVTHQGVLHAIGGEQFSGTKRPCPWDTSIMCDVNEIPSHDHFVYDAVNDYWSEGAPVRSSRFRFAAASGPDAVWVFGGTTNKLLQLDAVEALYNTKEAYGTPLYYHRRSSN